MNSPAETPTFQAAAAAAQRGDYDLAISLAAGLLAANPRDANAWQVLGLAHGRLGRNVEALDAFRRADALVPNNPAILNSIGVLLKERGDLVGARAHLERSTRIGGLAEAHYNLAATLAALDERDEARNSYERAIGANPRNAEALGRYARFLEEEHDTDRARDTAERALAIQKHNLSAQLALASLDARDGAHEEVIQRLQMLLAATRQTPSNAAILHGMLARSLEKLGRHAESFAACTMANDLQHAHYAEIVAQRPSPRSPHTLARLASYFETLHEEAWTVHGGLDGPSPVFLLGFPRSGTTLLDQILTAHGSLAVLEEKENMIDAWSDLVLPEDGPSKLAALSQADVNRYRALFWERARRHLTEAEAGKLIVDKLPLDTALLGLIHRLFPEAKIIFTVRDPRDVIVSCFQQTFAMNAAMYQFLRLDTAARYYDQVMSLGALCRRKLPLNIHEVRYESVVSDLRGEIEPLLDFLGVNWNDQVGRYYEKARTRVIKTPSAKQVIERPYLSSIGKWRHYEQQLQPVLPILQPWAATFGY